MLFTRCPECNTTFRVTHETLNKARGQVRCGRCASVFNAHAELHDATPQTSEPDAAIPGAAATEQAASPPPAPAVTPPSPPPASSSSPEPAPTGRSVGATALTAIVEEAKQAAANEQTASATERLVHADLSANEVDLVLADNAGTHLPPSSFGWPAIAPPEQPGARSRGWGIATALAFLALGVQWVHHSRSDIAKHPTFGAWIRPVYAALGAEIAPDWNVHQYRIVDWVATAAPNPRGLGSLKITARIQNRGPARQPYPAVQLRLKDRWEDAVGSRLFTPSEYLPTDTSRGELMSPGETARAEIEVIDPGPDAYGFELDVCIEVEASLVTCGTDEVFL
jgi:predicted Zn finger-like uncharacterized protein